jgi:hypothetical protein
MFLLVTTNAAIAEAAEASIATMLAMIAAFMASTPPLIFVPSCTIRTAQCSANRENAYSRDGLGRRLALA